MIEAEIGQRVDLRLGHERGRLAAETAEAHQRLGRRLGVRPRRGHDRIRRQPHGPAGRHRHVKRPLDVIPGTNHRGWLQPQRAMNILDDRRAPRSIPIIQADPLVGRLHVRIAVRSGKHRRRPVGAQITHNPNRRRNIARGRIRQHLHRPGKILAPGIRHRHLARDAQAGDGLRRQDQRLHAILVVRPRRGRSVVHAGNLKPIEPVEGVVGPLRRVARP